MSDLKYDWWRHALAGEEIGGATLPIHDGEANCGFYRRRLGKTGSLVGVAIFEHEGRLVALVDKRPSDPGEAWNWSATSPISEEKYRAWELTGIWPDEDSAVTASLAPPPAGHNEPPQDEADVLAGQVEAAAANAQDYADIRDDETAAKAQSARARLNELSGQADKKRETLKKPSLEAGRVIDARWNPIVKRAKEAADAIRKALGAHETRKDQEAKAALAAREAAARKAEEERQRLLREQLAAHPDAPAEMPPAPLSPEPVPAAPVQTTVKGAYGRAATIKEVKRAAVVDQDLAYDFLKMHKELKELIAKLAQRAVDAGHTVPGVMVSVERDVR